MQRGLAKENAPVKKRVEPENTEEIDDLFLTESPSAPSIDRAPKKSKWAQYLNEDELNEENQVNHPS